jgi:hypothetical protein
MQRERLNNKETKRELYLLGKRNLAVGDLTLESPTSQNTSKACKLANAKPQLLI